LQPLGDGAALVGGVLVVLIVRVGSRLLRLQLPVPRT